jgi:hypothetical protein
MVTWTHPNVAYIRTFPVIFIFFVLIPFNTGHILACYSSILVHMKGLMWSYLRIIEVNFPKTSLSLTFEGREILKYLLHQRTLQVLSVEVMRSVRCRRIYLHLKPNHRTVIFNGLHVWIWKYLNYINMCRIWKYYFPVRHKNCEGILVKFNNSLLAATGPSVDGQSDPGFSRVGSVLLFKSREVTKE